MHVVREVFVARILIVYESKYGQTEKIAKFIFERMLKQGHSLSLMNLCNEDSLSPAKYDGIVVGGGLYMRRYPKRLQKWARKHAETLNRKPTAFFTVCLAVLQNDLKVQRDLRLIANNFFKKTAWYPKKRGAFAGALSYLQYGWVTKQMMHLIGRASGRDTDTSRNYEYTNWKDVGQFSDEFANSLQTGRVAGLEIYPT